MWSYLARLRADIPGPQGEVVQVFTEDARRFGEILETPERYASLPAARFERYLVFDDRDPDWPGLVVRANALDSHVVARVTSVALARSIADALNRIDDQEARKPKSWGYWWRAF